MKNTLFILLLALYLVSCQSNPSKDYIVLTGTISDASKEEFRLFKYNSSTTDSIPDIILAEDGSFSFDTITTGTGHYYFGNGGRDYAKLYLTNGGEYNLTAIKNKFRNTAKLTGTDPDASNYLMSKYDYMDSLSGDYAEFQSLNESDFIAKQKMINESTVSYLNGFKDIPKDFVEREREELHYYNLLTLAEYEGLHRDYAEQPNFKVSTDFQKQFEGVDFVNEERYKLRGSYNELVEVHFRTKAELAEAVAKEEGNEKYLATLKVYGAIPNDHIKNDLLFNVAQYEIGYTDNINDYYNTYMSVSTSKKNNEMITKKYEGLRKLSAGATSPSFENYVNHAGGTNSLSDFKGKYVYIDVWATWCGPCLAEVPFLNKVEKQFHGKNIEFISISIDNEKQVDAWRKMVTDDDKLNGIQLLAEKDFESDFITAYEINTIPRFIIIDPDGNIVSANAPRPSDPDLVVLFNELNI